MAWDALASPHSVVTRDAESLRYSFYTDDELRRLSVCQIYSTEQRDALQRPLAGGLYDPSMGPTDHYESCKTCGLDYATCPGHFGRIELCMPCYSPVLFPTLVQLLRGSCLHCGSFKADSSKLKPFGNALDMIDAGLLIDASKVRRAVHRAPHASRRRFGPAGREDAFHRGRPSDVMHVPPCRAVHWCESGCGDRAADGRELRGLDRRDSLEGGAPAAEAGERRRAAHRGAREGGREGWRRAAMMGGGGSRGGEEERAAARRQGRVARG